MIELGMILTKYVTIPILIIAGIGYLCRWLVERKKPIGEVEINIKYNDPEEIVIPLSEETTRKIDEVVLEQKQEQ